MSKKKLFVLGSARHGKDTFADLLRQVIPELSFMSSSLFVAERAVYPALKERYGYTSLAECYDDRVNHRAEWKDLISGYNNGDLSRLARELFSEHDIYVGLRCIRELTAARQLADLSIWVDRSLVLPPELASSNTLTPQDCDIIVDNNGSLEDLAAKAERFGRVIYRQKHEN